VSSPRRRRAVGNQPPVAAVVFALIGLVLFFGLPLAGLLWRAPWGEFMSVLREDSAQQALRLSLICSLSATGLSVLFGIPIAWLLARGRFAGLSVVRALALLPLVLPPVVGGVALFYAFGRRGLIGQWLDLYWLILPAFSPEKVVFGWTEIGVSLGFLGLFGWCVVGFLGRHPVAPHGDPAFESSVRFHG